jgi:hypothetical protein
MQGDGERTLEAFYERLQPFANAFMALFERDRLPHRSTLSGFLAALNQTAVESLRTLASRKICWLALWRRRRNRVDCGPARNATLWYLIVMARNKPPA